MCAWESNLHVNETQGLSGWESGATGFLSAWPPGQRAHGAHGHLRSGAGERAVKKECSRWFWWKKKKKVTLLQHRGRSHGQEEQPRAERSG